MSKYDFHGKIALVTGGIKGIGRAIAVQFLQCNAKVVICYDRDDSAAMEMDDLLKKLSLTDYLIMKKDVSSREQIHQIIKETEIKWPGRISFLINNAGILKQGNFFELTDEQWDHTFQVNLKSAFMLGQECLKNMQAGDGIVNISSIGGQIGGDRAPDYAASKAALISLTRSLARLGAKKGVRSNAVAPGWIETPIFEAKKIAELKEEAKEKILLGRMGQPEEIAAGVLFLLSDESSFITGHTLNINGGMYFG